MIYLHEEGDIKSCTCDSKCVPEFLDGHRAGVPKLDGNHLYPWLKERFL